MVETSFAERAVSKALAEALDQIIGMDAALASHPTDQAWEYYHESIKNGAAALAQFNKEKPT